MTPIFPSVERHARPRCHLSLPRLGGGGMDVTDVHGRSDGGRSEGGMSEGARSEGGRSESGK